MPYKPSDPYYVEFVTSLATGAAANADSLPVATANKNGTDDAGFVLTVANLDAGRYKATGTIPAGYLSGDVVNVTVAATIAGVAAKGAVDSFVLDSRRLSDIGAAQVALTSPLAADTLDVTLIAGDSYFASENRSLSWTDTGNTWPDLTGATVQVAMRVVKEGAVTTAAAVITVPSGVGKAVRVELTATQTAGMVVGRYPYRLVATLASGHVVTLAAGHWQVYP